MLASSSVLKPFQGSERPSGDRRLVYGGFVVTTARDLCSQLTRMADSSLPEGKKGDPWFEDGNIILLTSVDDSAIAYKVHRGVLARHSEVFRSMFEVAEPPPHSENFEQCPVVYMHDVPVELSNIIKALYDGVNL